MNPCRNELRTSPEASKEHCREYQSQQLQAEFESAQNAAMEKIKDFKSAEEDHKTIQEQADKPRELSDSQDRAEALKSHYREAINDNKNTAFPQNPEPEKQPPSLHRQPEEKIHSDKSREIAESSDVAAEMLKQYRQKQAERQEQ